MKRLLAVISLLCLTVFCTAQTAIDRCQQNACFGYSAPSGPSQPGMVYRDISQTPPVIYCAQAGGWASCSGSSGATGPAGGDLSGTYPNPTAIHLSGTAASTVTLPGSANGSPFGIFIPGISSGGNIDFNIGRAPSGAAAAYMRYIWAGDGFNDNDFAIGPYGFNPFVDIYVNEGTFSIGGAGRSHGFALDVVGASHSSVSYTSPIHSIGTASNTDSAQQLTIPATTGTATYTTSGNYLNHPVCTTEILATTTVITGIGVIGANWVGANGGTNTTANSPTGTWTLTLTPATNPVASTPIDLTCFVRP